MVNVWWYEKNLGSACINGSGCGGDKAWGGDKEYTTTNKLMDKKVFVGPTFGAHLLGRHSPSLFSVFAPCLHMMAYRRIMFVKSFGHVFSNLPLFSTLNPICSTQHVVKKTCLTCQKNKSKEYYCISLLFLNLHLIPRTNTAG